MSSSSKPPNGTLPPHHANGGPQPTAQGPPRNRDVFGEIASWTTKATGGKWGFLLALLSVLVWAVIGPYFRFSEMWQLVINTGTTIVTFLMVFLIQNSQNRDAAAMQAKLDEIIRASSQARNRLIGIEHLTERELREIRDAIEREHGDDANEAARRDAVGRLLGRL